MLYFFKVFRICGKKFEKRIEITDKRNCNWKNGIPVDGQKGKKAFLDVFRKKKLKYMFIFHVYVINDLLLFYRIIRIVIYNFRYSFHPAYSLVLKYIDTALSGVYFSFQAHLLLLYSY